MISEEVKNSIIGEICSLIGMDHPPQLLITRVWFELESGIWLITEEQKLFVEKYLQDQYKKKIKYAGIYLGKIRKNFGLSMEALYPLQPFIKRYCIIKGKTLQKYLYGKTVTIGIQKDEISNIDYQKIIVMTPEKQAVGISSFSVLEEYKAEEKTYLMLKLEPITDLGMFLRNERTMFE